MKVKIFETTDEGQVLAGTFSLEGKKLVVEANHSYDTLMDSVKEHTCYSGEDEEVTAEKDPQRWLELLPLNLSGSYLRAEASQ